MIQELYSEKFSKSSMIRQNKTIYINNLLADLLIRLSFTKINAHKDLFRQTFPLCLY